MNTMATPGSFCATISWMQTALSPTSPVSGGPHNVGFDPATVPADVKAQLDANMGTDKMGELSSAMKTNAGESVTVSFANIKPGQYPFHCVPHLALGMKGVITVQ